MREAIGAHEGQLGHQGMGRTASTFLLRPLVALSTIVPVSAQANASAPEAREMIDLLISDMTCLHEAKAQGVRRGPDWYDGPPIGHGSTPPQGWSAATMWGQVYVAEGGSPATNVRVQIREPVLLYLRKRDGKWHQLQRHVSVEGAAFRQDYANDDSEPADARRESDDSVSVKLTPGRNYHFWPAGRAAIDPTDIDAMASASRARLVLDDPSAPDDRDRARIVASCGGDYRRSREAQWKADWSNNGDWAVGRFRFVRNDWAIFTATTAAAATLHHNPPPLYP